MAANISEQTNTPPHLNTIDHHYRNLYNKEAINYDRHRFKHTKGQAFNTVEQRHIYELLGVEPGQTMLDVAAGTGRIAAYMAQQGLNVTALDLTHNMLLQAQARAADLDNIRFVESNGRVLPFADNQFDAVISIRFLHLFPATLHRPFVQEMWRVLKPGGVMLVQFDSALAGGIVTYPREAYRQFIRGHKPRHYVWPYEIERVFKGIEPYAVHGFSPIGARALRNVHPGSADVLETVLSSGLRGFLANRVFVRAVKPAA